MANLKDLRGRIRSVKNTRQITKAMKMIAAARLRKAQEAIEAKRPYAQRLHEVIETLATRAEREDHPLLQ
ncbi:MAG: F-type H+-transporting ATPase subunit gamma, partial [Myxococcota bacterium]